MRNFANVKGWIVDDILKDIGSELNYKRKNWNELLELAQKREIKTVLISHKDRFVRETLSPQEELVQDLISIIHVFSCRIYGLRRYKKKLKEDNEL